MRTKVAIVTVITALALVASANAAHAPTVTVADMGTPISPATLNAVTGSSIPSGVPCWFHQFSHQWGIAPVQQVLIDKVNWCANNAETKLIYRSSQVSEQTDVVVQGSTTQTHLAGAADGSTYYVEWEACGNFTLGLPYHIGYNVQDCMAMWVRDDGGYDNYWHN